MIGSGSVDPCFLYKIYNAGIKQGRISSPYTSATQTQFDPKDSNPLVSCSSEMDVEFLIYLNLPDTTQVSILKKNYKNHSG